VTTTTSNGPGPPGCDVEIDKDADEPTVSAGTRAGYTITVRNRGRAVARNIRACDRIPRRMTFVSADRRLRRLGRQRCLMIPLLRPGQRVSFHLELQVSADAQPGQLPNIADIIPEIPSLPPGILPPAVLPETPPAPGPGRRPAIRDRIKAIIRARANVRIVKAPPKPRVSRRPRFTG
jgi:uncharacterized repeat protein (TIGR01451 family)